LGVFACLKIAESDFRAIRTHIFRFHLSNLFWIRRNNSVEGYGIARAELIDVNSCLKGILVEKSFLLDISAMHNEAKSSIYINSRHMSTDVKLWATVRA